MLLIDGVKYKEWVPQGPQAEDEFEQEVKKHTQEIFGTESIYFDIKQKLKSEIGTGSIPDGFCIVLRDFPLWHLVEMELSTHPLHDHIVSQVGRFISGIENTSTQKKIVDAIDNELAKDDLLRLRLKKAIEPVEVYKFLSNLISKPPILTVIIEKETPELRQALRILNYPQIKVVEFQTLTREGTEGLVVHAHLFEPLYPTAPPPPPLQPGNSFEIIVQPSYINQRYITIRAAHISLFPGFNVPRSNVEIELDTDVGLVKTKFHTDPSCSPWLGGGGLNDWFKAHAELKPGDKVKFTVIEPMKKYRLEISK